MRSKRDSGCGDTEGSDRDLIPLIAAIHFFAVHHLVELGPGLCWGVLGRTAANPPPVPAPGEEPSRHWPLPLYSSANRRVEDPPRPPRSLSASGLTPLSSSNATVRPPLVRIQLMWTCGGDSRTAGMQGASPLLRHDDDGSSMRSILCRSATVLKTG